MTELTLNVIFSIWYVHLDITQYKVNVKKKSIDLSLKKKPNGLLEIRKAKNKQNLLHVI